MGRKGDIECESAMDSEEVGNPLIVLSPSLPKLSKGQLISKGLFVFFNSSKKRTKNVFASRLGQKLKFSSSFFGRIEDTKKTFRN